MKTPNNLKHNTERAGRGPGAAPRGAGLLPTAVLLAAATLLAVSCSKESTMFQAKSRVVRGDVIVTILQGGELQAKNSNSIINETEASCKIVEIVEDGMLVKKGDILVELESAELDDRVTAAETKVTGDEAAYQQAQDTDKIADLKYKTDLDSAELAVDLAKLDLEKYEDAQFPQQVEIAEGNILMAKAQLNQSSSTLLSTRELVAKGFVNRLDLEDAFLAAQSRNISLRNMIEALRILREYTLQKETKQLKNVLAEADGTLERLVETRKAEKTSSLVEIAAKKTAWGLSQIQLERLRNRLAKSTIRSEYDGLVFYPKMSRFSSRANIEKGASLFPKQKILEFPDLSAWVIKVGVPESIIKKVQEGMKVIVMLDAMPGEILHATVDRISMAPDRTDYYSSDSKAYAVYLDVPDTRGLDLKPGMSVMAEIIIKELKNVLSVPLQAVRAEGDNHYVYLVDGNNTTRTPVEVGDHSEKLIEITSGLEEGQEILLYAPIKAESSAKLTDSPLENHKKNGSSTAASADGKKTSPDRAAGPGGRGGEGGRQGMRQEGGPGGGGERGVGNRQRGGSGGAMTEEQRKQMRERLQNMSPGDREKLRQPRTQN